MKLFASCSHCGTVFSLVQEQLTVSNGWVRCGHCMEIFNANEQLVELSPPSLAPAPTPTSAPVPVPESKPEPTAVDASFDSTLLINPIDIAQTIPQRELDTVLVDAAPSKVALLSNVSQRIMWACVALVLLGALLGQLVYYQHHYLRLIAPGLVQKWCDVVGCSPIARQQINGWLIENSSFQKVNEQSFQLETTLKNISNAHLMVPYLELTLLDLHDLILVRHVVAPDVSNPVSLPSQAEHQYRWIVTPQATNDRQTRVLSASDIAGYRLTLFYP